MLRAHEIKENMRKIQAELKSEEAKLEGLKTHCVSPGGHDWGDVSFNPIYREAYTIPSDVDLGIELGVDTIRSRTYVPAETTKRWRRECKKCGYAEETQRTKTVSRGGKIPGTAGQEEVPVFSSDERRW